ncbi:MAG: HAD-IB family hydrolase [Pseudomonadota bacterium]|nr:HAD-IB family hydrolase [Pseudomonadota bacterium]
MKIAFFDFDGTITKSDTFVRFIRFFSGDTKFFLGLFFLLPKLIAYKFKIISNQFIKESIITYFFKGVSEDIFREKALEFSLTKIDFLVRKDAMQKILWHRNNGHKIVVVTASVDYWIKPWCDKNSIELVSTRLEIKNNILTGLLLSKNCVGPEKVKRIKEKYELSDYEYIYAYGNSKGDDEMLKMASEGFYRIFKN